MVAHMLGQAFIDLPYCPSEPAHRTTVLHHSVLQGVSIHQLCGKQHYSSLCEDCQHQFPNKLLITSYLHSPLVLHPSKHTQTHMKTQVIFRIKGPGWCITFGKGFSSH